MVVIALVAGELLRGHFPLPQFLAASHQPVQVFGHESSGRLPSPVLGFLDRWFGTPSLFQPDPVANTDFVYYDVTGATQPQLVAGIEKAEICKTYGPCLVDPAQPAGTALGLEGDRAVGSYYYCYTPSTTVLAYRHFIVLPRWSPEPDGAVTASLVREWNDLVRTIYIHEAGHVAIAEADIALFNREAEALPTCDALFDYWRNPQVWDRLNADQNAYHARLRADCRAEIGCIPYDGWEGWYF